MPSTNEPLITIDPDILGGTPVIAGTRLPVTVILDNLRDGLTVDEIVFSYPTLSKEVVEAVLADPEQVQRARYVHQANAIINLDRPGLSQEVADVQNRIIAGEITAQQAIDMKIAQIKNEQRMQAEKAKK